MMQTPTNILFTLPNLSPTDSKLPRVLAIIKSLDRKHFQPIVSVDHAGRINENGLMLFKEINVPVYTLRMSPNRKQTIRSLIEMLGTPGKVRKAHISIQVSSDYSQMWTEPLLARLGGVRYWIPIKTNIAFAGIHWHLRLRQATRVVTETASIANLLAKRIPAIENRIIVIPKGIDTEKFRPRPRDESLINELSLNPNHLILGCVAHIIQDKDHPSLLHAFKKLSRSNVMLILIGRENDTEYVRQVRKLVIELDLTAQVRLLGLRRDIQRLHSIMDGLVLSSSAEASPTAVLEGMSSGLPVIVSNVGGIPDIVQHGINGWVVPRGDHFVEQLANALKDWADNTRKRQEFGIASRRIAEKDFSLARMTQSYINLFESFLEHLSDKRE